MDNTSPDWLTDRIQRNVRLLKSIRDMTDEGIADAGGFTSRQVFSNRLAGRSAMTVEDLARIAAACRVEPYVLMLRSDEVLTWVEDHIGYESPRYDPAAPNPNKARR